MDVERWLALAAVIVVITAAVALFARTVSRGPAVSALITSFRGLGPCQLWRLALRVLRDPRVPRRARLLLLAVLLYLMLPFDVIPDFLPVIGQLDDLLVVVLGAWAIARLVPVVVIQEHRRAVLTDAHEPKA